MSKQAMKLALEALEGSTDKTISIRAMKALQEALAEQPAQQEPVAWMHEWEDGERIPMLTGRDDRNNDQPKSVRPLVYGDTPQAQRKPLTDEREAFEAHWYTKYHSGSVSARSDGSYVHPHVQRAWEAWLARAAQE